MTYLFIIVAATLFISGVVCLAYSQPFLFVLGYTILAVVTVAVVDAITATICRLLPKRWVSQEYSIFRVSAKEKRLYEKFHIRKWKDKIPDLGGLTGFYKKMLGDAVNLAYINRFLQENRYGEIVHIASCLTGFSILFLFPTIPFWIFVSALVACVSALLNFLPICVLRYNSYKLEQLRAYLLKKR